MKNKRLLLAIFAILMSTGLLYAYEDYLPSDRYGFVNVFKIDNIWEFKSGSLDELKNVSSSENNFVANQP